ncbi:MAG TPA: glycosyltransferase family A protein [Flavobacteriaceae bacterium]|nr:glycosyltransferase family A protein [Flavobacteriaceae bacterium]
MKIGIGVTTYNRNGTLDNTIKKIKEYLPEGAELVIVDDGSISPPKNATFIFEKNQGTPIAKNKCLELLYNAGCTDLFLFDSDCYPMVKGWEKPYLESKEPHLNFTFKYSSIQKNGVRVCENPNGCMMYIRREVLEKVGGFDTDFKYYGYWHAAFSNRVYHAGLTSYPFMDVIESRRLFVSLDEKKTVRTSRPDRGKYLRKNKALYDFQLSVEDSRFIDFKSKSKISYSNPFSTEKNIGRAYNEFCESVPDGNWICLQDGDIIYLTPDWGVQIEQAINAYGNKFSLIGCLTNRLGRAIQLADGVDYNNHDMKYHHKIARQIAKENFGKVEDITKKRYIAGMFMLFPKTTWEKHKFSENDAAFDDTFSKAIIKGGGKLGLMTGLYVYHSYRIWSDTPRHDRKHLL